MHKIEGVNFVKPSEIFAKLFEAMPVDIPNFYALVGIILIVTGVIMVNYLGRLN